MVRVKLTEDAELVQLYRAQLIPGHRFPGYLVALGSNGQRYSIPDRRGGLSDIIGWNNPSLTLCPLSESEQRCAVRKITAKKE